MIYIDIRVHFRLKWLILDTTDSGDEVIDDDIDY